VINAIRAHLAEFGIVAAVGRNGVEQLLGVVADSNDKRLPEVARASERTWAHPARPSAKVLPGVGRLCGQAHFLALARCALIGNVSPSPT
jgi:hypothetical protein